MTSPNRNQGPNGAAQQRRRDQLRREEEAARLREKEEAVNALLLLRAGFGEFGLWGNVPGNVPGMLPLQWQQNWQSVPGARPVSFGPIAVGGSNQQTTATTTTMSNVPSGTSRGTTSHGRPAVSTVRLDTLAAVAVSSQHLPLALETHRPLEDRTNGATSSTEVPRARSRAPPPEGLRHSRAPSPEGPRRSQVPSPEGPNWRGSSTQ